MIETRGMRDQSEIIENTESLWERYNAHTAVVWLIYEWFSIPENVLLILTVVLRCRISESLRPWHFTHHKLILMWSDLSDPSWSDLSPTAETRLSNRLHLTPAQQPNLLLLYYLTPHKTKMSFLSFSASVGESGRSAGTAWAWPWVDFKQKVGRALKVWPYKQLSSDTLPGPVKQMWRSWHLLQPHRDKAA